MLTFLLVRATTEDLRIRRGSEQPSLRGAKESADKQGLVGGSFLPICQKTHIVKSHTDDVHCTKKAIVPNLLVTVYQPTLIALPQHIHT